MLLIKRKAVELFDITRIITTDSVFEETVEINLTQIDLEVKSIQ